MNEGDYRVIPYEPNDDDAVRQLRAEIKIGIDQLDRGEGEPLDMDEIWSELQRRMRGAKRQ